jgi:hypothetical protein
MHGSSYYYSDEDSSTQPQKQLKSLKKQKPDSQSSSSSDKHVCVVCMDKDKNILLGPCNHLCVCQDCSVPLKKCPMCRGDIEKKTKVFG